MACFLILNVVPEAASKIWSELFLSAIGRFCLCFSAIGRIPPMYIQLPAYGTIFRITGGAASCKHSHSGSLKKVTETKRNRL